VKEIKLRRQSGGSRRAGTMEFTQVGSTLVDDQDFDWASQWRWGLTHKGYAKRVDHSLGGTITVRLGCEILRRKGVILQPGQTCDHENRVRLDNQRHNLRAATSRQQAENRVYRNVLTPDKARAMQQAQVEKRRKRKSHGLTGLFGLGERHH